MRSERVKKYRLAGLAFLAVPLLFRAIAAEVPKLDLPPTATQKSYAPADHQVVEINPPPFIWVPVARVKSYTVQLSRSEKFSEKETRTFSGLAQSVFVPHETLPAGKWFWRYGVETADGIVYGRARPFTMVATARAFPFPKFDQVIANVPAQRPRLFFPEAQLKTIRSLAPGELKGALESLKKTCEKAIGEDLVAEPPKPKTGSERVHVMRTTRPPMDLMERCALAYLVTGERPFGLEAKRRLQHFFAWDPEGPTGLFGYDEPAMWMMMRGTRAYDWTYDLFTPAERAHIEPMMKIRAKQFLTLLQRRPFESNPYESHAGRMPGFLGEAAISFAHEWPEAKEWLEYATLLYCTSYPAWGGDDGGWQEGPHYWSAYMGFASHFVVALRAATGVDLMQKPFFRNTPFYGLYTATPYHEHSPFGDGQTGHPRGLGAVMYAFSTLTQNPHFRWHAEAAGFRPGGDVLSLATYDPSLKARSPLELPSARHFASVGLVSMHTALGKPDEDISFLMRSSPFGSVSHGHADQNAFVIEAFGRGLATATGFYPWYGSPHHNDWTRATRAVNSVLVNGAGQVRRSWDAKGAITAFESSTDYDYTEGEAAPAYGGKLNRFRRQVVHVRPGIFVMFDELAAPAPATYQWLLHAYDQIQVNDSRRSLRIERAPAAMDVHLLLPEKIAFSQTDKFEPEPEQGSWTKSWHLTASTIERVDAAQFLAVMLPHRLGNEVALPQTELVRGRGALGVRIKFPDGSEEMVAFRTEAAPKMVECGGFETDGRVMASRRAHNGSVTRHLLIEGTVINEKGRRIAGQMK